MVIILRGDTITLKSTNKEGALKKCSDMNKNYKDMCGAVYEYDKVYNDKVYRKYYAFRKEDEDNAQEHINYTDGSQSVSYVNNGNIIPDDAMKYKYVRT